MEQIIKNSDIKELDIKKALKHLQDNEQLLVSLLRSFSEDFSNASELILSYIENDHFEAAARMAHTIKSLSATLCAYDLNEAAANLEKHLKKHEVDDSAIFLFENSLTPIVNAINGFLLKLEVKQLSVAVKERELQGEKRETLSVFFRSLILIVDDYETERLLLKNALGDLYETILVSSGEEAIEQVAKEGDRIDLILLDVSMPGMSGMETCRKIQKLTRHDIPIIFVTATTDVEYETEGLELGAIDYLHKPVSIPVIRARIKNNIELKTYKRYLKGTVKRRTQTMNNAVVELGKSSSVKDSFLSAISHELRTPLNGISATLDVLKEKLGDDDKALQTAEYSTELLGSMISNILLFSESLSGNLYVNLNQSSLGPILEKFELKYDALCASKGLRFESKMQFDSEQLYAFDVVKVEVMVDQLLDNAVKFTETGKVNFDCRIQDIDEISVLEIKVEDTGVGISEQKLDNILTHFSGLDSSYSRRLNGLGIGLAVCHQVIKALNGHMKIESDHRGSIVTLSIPLNPADSVVERREERDIVDTKWVLVVDDNQVNQLVLKNMLKKLGYEVELADNGHKVVPLIQNRQFAIIFMDCQMPVMDGFETTKYIRQSDTGNANIPIIAVTANAMSGDQRRCLNAGMDIYLTKPVTTSKVKNAVDICSQKSQRSMHKEIRILVAEDHDQMRNLVKFFFSKTDATVDLAAHGKEAVELASKNSYAFVLMDIEMPIMNGLEAFSKIRDAGHTMPIYALTGNNNPKDTAHYKRLGFSGYLSKPVDPAQLMQVLELHKTG